jgi:hypothetical protein
MRAQSRYKLLNSNRFRARSMKVAAICRKFATRLARMQDNVLLHVPRLDKRALNRHCSLPYSNRPLKRIVWITRQPWFAPAACLQDGLQNHVFRSSA